MSRRWTFGVVHFPEAFSRSLEAIASADFAADLEMVLMNNELIKLDRSGKAYPKKATSIAVAR